MRRFRFPDRHALACIAAALPLLHAGCVAPSSPRPAAPPGSEPSPPALARHEFSEPQMGVPFRLVVYAPHRALAQTAARAAFDRVAQLNAIFSDYDPDSEISRLCHETPPGTAVPISDELAFLLDRSQRLARTTDGAFDVTVGPLVNLWRHARRRRELPPPHLLQEARSRVGWRLLDLDPRARTLALRAPNMRLDFGGIAKGYAADEALRVLREHGLTRALVAAAGDVRAGDAPPGQSGWRVEFGHADVTPPPAPRVAFLRHAALATSGDVYQRLEIGGKRYSHILDPRTGLGLTDHSLVTVIAPDGTTADSLATAVSVLGPDAGLRRVERTRGAAALILRARDGGLEVRESRRLHRWLAPP